MRPMITEQQNDILSINQVQLLLAEKRTALAVMRTGIAVLRCRCLFSAR